MLMSIMASPPHAGSSSTHSYPMDLTTSATCDRTSHILAGGMYGACLAADQFLRV